MILTHEEIDWALRQILAVTSSWVLINWSISWKWQIREITASDRCPLSKSLLPHKSQTSKIIGKSAARQGVWFFCPYQKRLVLTTCKLIKYQGNSSCAIMCVILMTTVFYKAMILQGETWCWSLLGLKGLILLSSLWPPW